MPKKRSYQRTLASFNVHTRTGLESFLNEVAKWYEAMFPARADFFKRSLKNLQQITTDGYAKQHGDFYCSARVPTELLLFIQRWIPEFGRDSKDFDLLRKVWCDLVRPRKDRRRRTRLFLKDLPLAQPRPSPAP